MISFKAFKENKINLKEVASEIRESISVEDIFFYSKYELTYRSLKLFNFKNLKMEEESVEKYAQKVLSATGLIKKVDNPINSFVIVFLNMGTNLLQVKNSLENEAKGHLCKVQTLLDHYDSLQFIKNYNQKPLTPRNNEERKQLTFYKRTLTKKEEIIKYLLKDILERALMKASSIGISSWGDNLKEWQEQFELHDDFPYLEMPYGFEIKYELNMEKLDYRLINPLLNKLSWINPESYHESDYTTEIDRGFQIKIKNTAFFTSLLTTLDGIPVVRDRRDIFEEIQFLFNEQKWYALYSLILPQVEGIFSEMQEMIAKSKTKGSLTEKVFSIRPYYEHAHYTFDYYEFTLADLRNRFSHTGKVNDPRSKCYRLLLDIRYLLNIFTDFDAPLSKLTKIMNDGVNYFKHIGHLNNFLNLLQQTKNQEKLASISPQVDKFVYKCLIKELNLKKIITLLEKDFETTMLVFENTLCRLMREDGFKIFESSIGTVNNKIRQIELAFNHLPILINEKYKLLFDTYQFINNFLTFFPKTPKPIRDSINQFKIKHDNTLKVLNFLSQKAKFEIAEDFLLYDRKLIHVIKD